MDDELLELQKQFESAQQSKSSIRLSDRNVVELVQKLHELHIIDFDHLHTVSGKESITPEQLRREITSEINKLGRVSLIDLADITSVDLYHVEKQAEQVVSGDPGLMLIQGEIISQSYWDSVAEEINERLQECSQLALAELAAQLQISSELVTSVLEPRLGTMVKGRLEGGQLYTPAYVARVGAMVRGAARGITVPINLCALWSTLQKLLQEMDGAAGVAVEGSFFQSLFNGLVKEGEVLGSVRAGAHWTPSVFAIAQRECIDSFFSQNSFISYDALHKLGISQPVQFLQSRYPEGKLLDTVFVHPSMIEILDAATEDAVERGSWIDSLSVLPASFGSQDASKILSLCPSVQSALKSVDDLKQKLLYTSLELETVKMEANEALKKHKEEVKNLLNLLKAAYQERDEAKDQLQKLLNKLMPSSPTEVHPRIHRHVQHESPLVIPTKANSSITESNSLSETYNLQSHISLPVDSFLDAVSSPEFSNINVADSGNVGHFVNQPFVQDINGSLSTSLVPPAAVTNIDAGTPVIESIAEGKKLPQHGKLLQSVMEAGPLLQTLLLVGQLPRWRNPPPLQPFKIPSFSIKGCETMNVNQKPLNSSPYHQMSQMSS